MGVGQVQQRDVAEGLELEEALGPVVGLEPARVQAGARRDREELHEVPTGNVEAQCRMPGTRRGLPSSNVVR